VQSCRDNLEQGTDSLAGEPVHGSLAEEPVRGSWVGALRTMVQEQDQLVPSKLKLVEAVVGAVVGTEVEVLAEDNYSRLQGGLKPMLPLTRYRDTSSFA
jgi:hypothetical protein